MCGITAIYSKSGLAALNLVSANSIVSHRGPDDEGYLLWSEGVGLSLYAGIDTSTSTRQAYNYEDINSSKKNWTVGLGHRRLSIIDLSPTGHQPMVLQHAGLSITYNGEIYNYIELRRELEQQGHQFKSGSDTEVILHAWSTWGEKALHRFNGMFAFVLLDTRRQKMYAVRDRFGVKPLYYTQTPGYIAFASEVKQLRALPAYRFELDEQIAYDYLRYGLIDHAAHTFDVGIDQVMPGTMVIVDISAGNFKISSWYSLRPTVWKGTEQEACERFYELLKDSVKLRMRSDVPVGSALSGGLDSSTIVCLMREVLTDQGASDHLIKTITSCQVDKKYDEWEYAYEVINKVKADAYQVFPSFEKLQHDLEKMTWHMDYPFGSTSQFSQWCVFEEAKKQGLTVMIDGQGADEQLAGYGGNDMALYTGLMRKGRFLKLVHEARSYKQQKGRWPAGFLLGAVQTNFPYLLPLFPQNYQAISNREVIPDWLNKRDVLEDKFHPKSLRGGLSRQVLYSPLPSLLRYEDRNSMAFSVESRVPFMDYRLIEFTLGLPEELIYRKGQRKYILRKAFVNRVPDKILSRTDKMGFISPEERWLKEDGRNWFEYQIYRAGDIAGDLLNKEVVLSKFVNIQNGTSKFNFEPWRLICFSNWIKNFK